MKKILLDFNVTGTKDQVQNYLALLFDFPDYYGKNLDALYDMLTEIRECTCVGIFGINGERPVREYLQKVKRVFADAEAYNPYLSVVFSDLEDNYDEEDVL